MLPLPSKTARRICSLLGTTPTELRATADKEPDELIFLDDVSFRLRGKQLEFNDAVMEQLFCGHKTATPQQGERMRREQLPSGGLEVAFYSARFLLPLTVARGQSACTARDVLAGAQHRELAPPAPFPAQGKMLPDNTDGILAMVYPLSVVVKDPGSDPDAEQMAAGLGDLLVDDSLVEGSVATSDEETWNTSDEESSSDSSDDDEI